jgi:hypothetical protein
MTVLRERDFGIVATPAQDVVTSPLAGEAAPQGVETADAAEEAPAKPKRTRKKTEETK